MFKTDHVYKIGYLPIAVFCIDPLRLIYASQLKLNRSYSSLSVTGQRTRMHFVAIFDKTHLSPTQSEHKKKNGLKTNVGKDNSELLLLCATA